MGKKSKQNKRKLKSKKTHKRYHQHGGKTVDEYKEEIEKADIFKLDEIVDEINKDPNNNDNDKQPLFELIKSKKQIEIKNSSPTVVTNTAVTDTAVTNTALTNTAVTDTAEENDQTNISNATVNQQENIQDTDFKNKLSKIIADSEKLLNNDPKYKAIIEQMKDQKNTEKLKEIQELIQTYNTNYTDNKPYVNYFSKLANSSTDTKNKLKSLGKSLESSLGSLGSFFGKKSDKDKTGDKSNDSKKTNDLSAPDYTQVQVTPQLLNNNGNPIKLNSDQTAIIIPTNEVDQIKNCIKPILNCDFKEYDTEGNVIKSQPEPSAPPMPIAVPIANASLVNNNPERNNSDINPKPNA